GDDARWYMSRRGVDAQPIRNAFAKSAIEHDAGCQLDEQHDALVALPRLTNGDAFENLRQLLDLAIDLRGADADAAGLPRRVRSPEDDRAAVIGEAHPVAVAPHARKSLEVRRVILPPVRIIPEADGH